jgi:Arc/MetJ-type ribon-helix-helix transcriptional regulator
MAKPLTLNDLPADLARFAEAEMAAGRFPSVEDVLRAGVDALRERAKGEWLASVRRDAAEGFASFDRGEGVQATADELMEGIDHELGLRP